MASPQTLLRELRSPDVETQARGLRRIFQQLGTDSLTGQPPADWQQQRDALTEAEPRMLELAESPDDTVRELAADALSAWLGPHALEKLLILARDPTDRVRASAVGGLESWPEDERAKDAILDAAQSGKWSIRMRAARALHAFTGPDVVDTLFESLVDPDSYVRQGAADSLAKRDPQEFLPRLRRLADHPAPQMLDAAMDLLGTVGTKEDGDFLAKTGSWLNLSQPAFVRTWARRAAKRIRARLK